MKPRHDYLLTFCVRRSVGPITEIFPMSELDDAFERMLSGEAHYRIVLVNDIQ